MRIRIAGSRLPLRRTGSRAPDAPQRSVQKIRVLLQRFYGRQSPDDETLWHKWSPFFPVRLDDGRLSDMVGQVWRRRTSQGWEYRQDEEADDEWFRRQR